MFSSHKPDWVTVNVGINDVWLGWEMPEMTSARPSGRILVDRLIAAGANVVLLPPTVIEENSRQRRKTGRFATYCAAMM